MRKIIEGKSHRVDLKRKEKLTGCNHYWIIDVPSGPTSSGVCKYCKEKRVFTNYMLYSSWEEDSKPLPELNQSLNEDNDIHSRVS